MRICRPTASHGRNLALLYAGEMARVASCGGDPRLSDTILDA